MNLSSARPQLKRDPLGSAATLQEEAVNIRSVIILGLLVGLLLNILGVLVNGVLLRDAWAEAIPVRPSLAVGGWIGLLLGLLSDFVFGPVLVWLYAATQVRFGPTLWTAIRAALVVWVLGVAIPYVGIVRIGWVPVGLAAATSVLALASFFPAAWLTVRYYHDRPITPHGAA